MQRPQKRDQRRRFCRTQVFSVSRHVAAALNHLSNELVLREAHGDAIETRAALAATVAKSVAIAALFRLEHERSLSLERRRAAEQALRYRIAAPCGHLRAPWRIAG